MDKGQAASNHRSLRTHVRFLVYIFGITLLCFLALYTPYRLNYEYEQQRKDVERDGRNLAAAFEIHVRNSLKNAEYHAYNIRDLHEKEAPSAAKINEYLEYAKTMTGLIDIQISDDLGNVAATAVARQKTGSVSGSDYFRFHKNNPDSQGFVGRTVPSGEFPTDAIPVSWSIHKPDGSFGGVVTVFLSADRITDFFAQMELGTDKITTLVGLDGVVRARLSGSDKRSGQNISESPLILNSRSHPSGSFSSFSLIDGMERMQCFRTIPEYSMVVSIGISTQEIYRTYLERKKIYIGAAVLAGLLVIGFCLALLREISKQRSLQEMLETANAELETANRKLAVANVHLEGVAFVDPLTGAWNRRSFERSADLEMNRAHRYHYPLSFMMIDIDHFKKVNDKYGHPVGDSVLVELVDLLQRESRETDFLARWGGEEFVLTAPYASAEEAVAIAERVRQNVSRHEFVNVGSVTVSIGVAEYSSGDSLESVLSRADKALYAAKRAGRNRVRLGVPDEAAGSEMSGEKSKNREGEES